MWLHCTTKLTASASAPTPLVLMNRPRSGAHQWVAREEYSASPSVPIEEFTDAFGNLCQRLTAPLGDFSFQAALDVRADDTPDAAPSAPPTPPGELPAETLPLLLPSRYCESDRFTQMAEHLGAKASPGYDQCAVIVDYIRRALEISPGSSAFGSAVEVNNRSRADSRGMAHLGISLCRALAIPARITLGFLEDLEPMELHAWFEAFVAGRWYAFDPTQPDLNGGRVALAHGRDAADVAFCTPLGAGLKTMNLRVRVSRLRKPPV